ncbi:MAG: DivIVA domain-containing protein [Nitrospirae bacterium]|nr:DivIVA domain-containing protein [Candidatus Manganitrophaceae bacterium]
MKLSPLELRQISFKKGFRGYSPLEVDTFIESLADDLEELLGKMADYKDQQDRQSKTIAELEKTEGALTETLLMAQKAMENVKANAQAEGHLIIRQAEVRAEEITAEAVRRETQLQGEIMNLQRAKGYLVEKIRGLIHSLERDIQWDEKDTSELGSDLSSKMKI